MRRLFFIVALAISVSQGLYGQTIQLGGGVHLGTGFKYKLNSDNPAEGDSFDAGKMGVFTTGRYDLGSPFKLSFTLNYCIPEYVDGVLSDVEYRHSVSSISTDFNLLYTFYQTGSLQFYGIGGMVLQFVGYKYRERYTPVDSEEVVTFIDKQVDNTIGLNIGVGSNLRIAEKSSLFLEAKYLVSPFKQFVLNGGILFPL